MFASSPSLPSIAGGSPTFLRPPARGGRAVGPHAWPALLAMALTVVPAAGAAVRNHLARAGTLYRIAPPFARASLPALGGSLGGCAEAPPPTLPARAYADGIAHDKWHHSTTLEREEERRRAVKLASKLEFALADAGRSRALALALSPEGHALLMQLVAAPSKALDDDTEGDGETGTTASGEDKCPESKRVDDLFKEMDTNSDGVLTKEEFRTFMERHKIEPREEAGDSMPTGRLIGLVLFATAVPYVGFGFMDNFIMIVAGDLIDHKLSTSLGFSTLAAAGLGNLLSDVAGVAAAGTIERRVKAMGCAEPAMSDERASRSDVSYARIIGAMVGVSVGCVIGMAPLGLGILPE